MININKYIEKVEEFINSIQGGDFTQTSEIILNQRYITAITCFNDDLVIRRDIYAAQVISGYPEAKILVKFCNIAQIETIIVVPKRIIRKRKLEKLLS